jgi:hypothetical protein
LLDGGASVVHVTIGLKVKRCALVSFCCERTHANKSMEMNCESFRLVAIKMNATLFPFLLVERFINC